LHERRLLSRFFSLEAELHALREKGSRVYDIANNQITGAAPLGTVGLDWQVGGLAADAPTASSAAMGGSSQVGQLVQAMASFGGGAADTSNPVTLGADTSQQTLLTTPQHT
jgi:hypothetical protein